jgi:hypothetical protein
MSGHFRSLWARAGDILIPTTITSQYKSKAREREAAKKLALLDDIQELTGHPVSSVARSLDGIQRRWSGVKANNSD